MQRAAKANQHATQTQLPLRVDRTLRVAGAGLGVVTVAAGVLGAVVTARHGAWFALAFEVVVALAGLTATLPLVRRRTASGQHPVMTLLVAAGTLLVAATLSWIGSGRQLGGVSLTPVLLARLTAAAALAALAGGFVVALRPRWALGRLALGTLLLALAAAPVAVGVAFPAVQQTLAAMHPVLLAAAATLGFLAWVATASAGVELVATALDPDSWSTSKPSQQPS